ncbi:hypothetical protein MLD38_009257 [Melastoma candidum]|uniref:Uncharacterized protein n=1 Tax=Melastoma candidum TaxID=119954 RepID=A0ACB9S0N9_9MYRT|nr:hypothetical protein MLD38_009257 [Melastoma candidum]
MDAVVARSSPPLLTLSCSPSPAPPRVLSLPRPIPLPSPSFSSSYYSCSHPIASQRARGGHVLAVPAGGGGTLVMIYLARAKSRLEMSKALEMLVENRITGFPVVDDDWKLVGLVSDYDLLALDTISAIVAPLGDPTRIQIDADILAKFRKLRLLIMHKVTYNGDPINFPSSLCWLEWLGYSSSTFSFSPSTALKSRTMPEGD